ncbi:MAG TPA: glutathione S-transferase [Allosphingosinicella sp.]|jgi:glutathione S-transferase|nr:glutathione S-transferase [Allosphingosinicella sp.]
MTYRLVLGNKNYSSWSMRAWLLMRLVGVEFEETIVPVYSEGARDLVMGLGGETGLAPVLLADGLAVWDTLAIFEFLHERHSSVWPVRADHRARARSYAGEVHSGYAALREAMPCNTRARGRRADVSPAVEQDIRRTAQIWEASGNFGSPWLFGAFCGADIMFAPVATRFQTYGIALSGRAASYCDSLLHHPLVVEWLAAGEVEPGAIPECETGY